MNTMILVSMTVILFSGQLYAQTTESSDIWEPFRYFTGSWVGHETGASGIGKGTRTYEFALNDKYLFHKNKSVFEPQEKNPDGEIHEDWGFVSYDTNREKFILREFHSEGFVIGYILEDGEPNSKKLVFTSESVENVPEGFRARLTITILSDDEFLETFELASTGKEYSELLRNTWKRK